MTVKEVLEAAREAALEIRRIEEQAELMRLSIGVQGHGYDVHSKSGILDPSRKIDELLAWEQEQVDVAELQGPIEDAAILVAGAEHVSDGLMVEVTTRYYLQAESWVEIARTLEARGIEYLQGHTRKDQIKILNGALEDAIANWERLGIAHLREMAQS